MQPQPTAPYAFPVGLRPVFDENGAELTQVKLVARTDLERLHPFAVVSNRYRLIKHEEAITAAGPILARLTQLAGQHEDFPVLEKAGARLLMSSTFSRSQLTLPAFRTPTNPNGLGTVGLSFRVYIVNSYNGSSPLTVQVAGLISQNGLMLLTLHGEFDVAVKHIGIARDIVLPDPDVILRSFHQSGEEWQRWTERTLSSAEAGFIVSQAKVAGLVSEKVLEQNRGRLSMCATAWDVYNAVVELMSAGNRKIQESTRIARLRRLNLLMNHALGV